MTDKNNDVYITGYIQGTNIDFDPSAGVALVNCVGGVDAFLAKFNSAGQYQWAFNVGGLARDETFGLAVDNNAV